MNSEVVGFRLMRDVDARGQVSRASVGSADAITRGAAERVGGAVTVDAAVHDERFRGLNACRSDVASHRHDPSRKDAACYTPCQTRPHISEWTMVGTLLVHR